MEEANDTQDPGGSAGVLIPHLFRREFARIVAVLARLFGIGHIETAEDIASESFLAALETWPYRGLPPNPTAWLYAIAKNKARNRLKRDRLFIAKIAPALRQETRGIDEMEIDLSEKNISDSQLQMLFAVCHPSLSAESSICLALRTLCGFGIDEIATAFLTNKETINKRLFRAREKLREERAEIEFPPEPELEKRLDTVLLALYLLYNEGYYSESQDSVLREELCAEAMRLVLLLMDNASTDVAVVHALFALMCFHASRFPARKGPNGEIILYADQDEELWDQGLVSKGAWHLHQASRGDVLSRYHLEASIAYWHTVKTDSPEKWENILQLYNRLLIVAYSPVAALNRTFALARARSKAEAIVEAEKLGFTDNPYYYALLGELYGEIDPDKAFWSLQQAHVLARTQADKRVIEKAMEKMGK